MTTASTRAWLGFLVAPGAPALALYLVNMGNSDAPLLAMILLPVAYAAALVLGLPAHWLLKRRGVLRFWAYIASGALVGLGAGVLMFGLEALLSWGSSPEHAVALLKNSPKSIVLGVLYAAIATAVFWWISIWPGRRSS